MIDEKIESFKLAIGSFLGVISSIFGQTSQIIIALILLMIIDTTFGWVKGFKTGRWKSTKAKWGIAGKITELILISLLYILNWIFKVEFIVYTGVYYFIACEVASILENYATINKNLPSGLLEILKKLQFNIGTFFISGLKKFLEKVLQDEEKNENEH